MIVPIWKTDDDRAGVRSAASSVKEVLQTAGIKVKLDDSEQRTPGWKFNFWEMKVCPLFLNINNMLVKFWLVVFHLAFYWDPRSQKETKINHHNIYDYVLIFPLKMCY